MAKSIAGKTVFKFKPSPSSRLMPVVMEFLNDHRAFEVVKRELFVYKEDVKKLMPKGKTVRVTVELVDEL